MKIGLLSPHYAFNYGAVLQAFALKEYLRSLGHDAIILNRRPAYQCAIPSLFGRIARKIEEFTKRNSFIKFEKEHLQPQTSLVIFQNDWENIDINTFDAVIVGSDQVWRDDYAFNAFGFNLFLDFVGNGIKKISYAPSLGKGSWNSSAENTEKVKTLLHLFDAISVRELNSIAVLKDKFDVSAQVVVDPTLLLTANDYIEKLKIKKSKQNHIATYILDYDDNFKRKIDMLSNDLGLNHKDIIVRSPKGNVRVMMNRFRVMDSVEDWITNIANSKYVITNSFHGMVFSIIFRKQFLVVMNTERGAERFNSLLQIFGLEDRLINSTEKNYSRHFNKQIDYNSIEPLIEKWRNHSKDYINRSLTT